MKILHTSDWHLGHQLYGKSRKEEFELFFKELIQIISEEKIEVLLIAGDIFDTSTPGNQSQTIYFNTLEKILDAGCRHIVVIGGNHDSPSLLNASKSIMRKIGVHIFGSVPENIGDEVLILNNDQGRAECVICAVPFLRDKDVRKAEFGESVEDKEQKILKGIRDHYGQVFEIAEKKRKELEDRQGCHIPLIMTGHLFIKQGSLKTGEGERNLYVGGLGAVGTEIFPNSVDYAALGHLHIPQKIGENEHIRYSGSPVPMGFGEAGQKKSVMLIEWRDEQLQITERPLSCYQTLKKLKGKIDEVKEKISELKKDTSNVWLELKLDEFNRKNTDLRGEFQDILEGTDIEILKIEVTAVENEYHLHAGNLEEVRNFDPVMFFDRYLEGRSEIEEEKEELKEMYLEIYHQILQEDAADKN